MDELLGLIPGPLIFLKIKGLLIQNEIVIIIGEQIHKMSKIQKGGFYFFSAAEAYDTSNKEQKSFELKDARKNIRSVNNSLSFSCVLRARVGVNPAEI